MKNKQRNNIAASVRDRLLNLAREQHEDFQLVLTRYGLERLLYRLSQSVYRDRFVLKGAMLFMLWGNNVHRPTRDVDFLGFGDSDEETLQAIFRDLCNISVEDDGLILNADSVQVKIIRDQTEYGDMRVKLSGELSGARLPIQADVGFGDAVTPEAKEIKYPTLLNSPVPHLMAYPPETVIAEKYQALVSLGMANSRMKDFYDLWIIAQEFEFDGSVLSAAIRNTFSRRQTPLPDQIPIGLSSEFHEDSQKTTSGMLFCVEGNSPQT